LLKLPYGISDFKTVITQGYVYVDKTRFIESMEDESNYCNLFVRPRKFGKTLLISMLMNYYDINAKDDFEQLFGNLYIGKHPTPERNRYAVIKFDFSGLDISNKEKFSDAFYRNIESTVRDFFVRYRHLLSDADRYIKQIDEGARMGPNVLSSIVYAAHHAGIRIYLFVDEGDCFARDLVAAESLPEDVTKMDFSYKIVRNFYELIESGKHESDIYRIFVSGVSTAGLGEASSLLYLNELSLDARYHEMTGFTQNEIDELLTAAQLLSEASLRKHLLHRYGGYSFAQRTENKLYNPAMTLYLINEWMDYNFYAPLFAADDMSDYSQLNTLLQGRRTRRTMLDISKRNRLRANLNWLYPLEWIEADQFLITHLFQLGLLTFETDDYALPFLKMPNQYARCIFNHHIYKERQTQFAEKIIFLDIDGVLQPDGKQDRFEHIIFHSDTGNADLQPDVIAELDEKYGLNYGVYDTYDVGAVYYDWDKKSVAELKRILETVGAKIVISSDWRDETINRMIDLCKIHGLDDYIIDATSKENHDAITAKNEKYRKIRGYRPLEIMYYLDTHPQIKQYVAIDDINMTEELGEQHTVVTHYKMTEKDADKCIALFDMQCATVEKHV
jgi:hypothetical protein